MSGAQILKSIDADTTSTVLAWNFSVEIEAVL
jgi:hypothetical protein